MALIINPWRGPDELSSYIENLVILDDIHLHDVIRSSYPPGTCLWNMGVADILADVFRLSTYHKLCDALRCQETPKVDPPCNDPALEVCTSIYGVNKLVSLLGDQHGFFSTREISRFDAHALMALAKLYEDYIQHKVQMMDQRHAQMYYSAMQSLLRTRGYSMEQIGIIMRDSRKQNLILYGLVRLNNPSQGLDHTFLRTADHRLSDLLVVGQYLHTISTSLGYGALATLSSATLDTWLNRPRRTIAGNGAESVGANTLHICLQRVVTAFPELVAALQALHEVIARAFHEHNHSQAIPQHPMTIVRLVLCVEWQESDPDVPRGPNCEDLRSRCDKIAIPSLLNPAIDEWRRGVHCA